MAFALIRPDPDTLVFRERRNWILAVFPLFVLPPLYAFLFRAFTDPSAAWAERIASIRAEPILMAFFGVPLLLFLPALFALLLRRKEVTIDRARRQVRSRAQVMAFDDITGIRLVHLVHAQNRLWEIELETAAGKSLAIARTDQEVAILASDEIADMVGVGIRTG